MNLSDFEKEVNEWAALNFGENSDNPHRPLLGVIEEVGELSHAHLKSEQGIRGTQEEHLAAKIDAVGDIVIYLANYCGIQGISLEKAIETAWSTVKDRDWKTNPHDGAV